MKSPQLFTLLAGKVDEQQDNVCVCELECRQKENLQHVAMSVCGGWGVRVRSWHLLAVRSVGLEHCFGDHVFLSQEENTSLTPATSTNLYLNVNQLMRIRAGG